MEDYIAEILKNFQFYNLACGFKDMENDLHKIMSVSKFKSDIPISLLGIMKELCLSKPQYYWKRDVALEIETVLDTFVKQDIERFNSAIIKSSKEFFESIRAYENISTMIIELRDVAFEEGYKTKLIRNPLFSQIYEDFLMNLYRVIRSIINEFSEKDYSNLNTIGAILPCLKKHGFNKSININVDLRNAVNHGNLFVQGNEIQYRYGHSPLDYKYEKISIWDYDTFIDEGYDIGCGIIVGLLKIISKYPEIIQNNDAISEENAREWFRLTFKNSKLSILYLDSVSSGGIHQLNVFVNTTIEDYNSLVFTLILLARGAFFRFPQYDSYFVGYEHNRSTSGFLRLTREQLLSSDDIGVLFKLVLESETILMLPILDGTINENAFKFHVFPKIKSDNFEVQDIRDCSITEYKRIKAKVILSEKYSKNKTRSIIELIVSEVKKLETPQNPYIETKYGDIDCDMVFLDIFTHSYDRKKFNLFPSNDSFVCTAHYYKDDSCPKLEHGGVMENLWKAYVKETRKNILIAWNPKI